MRMTNCFQALFVAGVKDLYFTCKNRQKLWHCASSGGRLPIFSSKEQIINQTENAEKDGWKPRQVIAKAPTHLGWKGDSTGQKLARSQTCFALIVAGVISVLNSQQSQFTSHLTDAVTTLTFGCASDFSSCDGLWMSVKIWCDWFWQVTTPHLPGTPLHALHHPWDLLEGHLLSRMPPNYCAGPTHSRTHTCLHIL